MDLHLCQHRQLGRTGPWYCRRYQGPRHLHHPRYAPSRTGHVRRLLGSPTGHYGVPDHLPQRDASQREDHPVLSIRLCATAYRANYLRLLG